VVENAGLAEAGSIGQLLEGSIVVTVAMEQLLGRTKNDLWSGL
jgi:hypothetical protein